MLANVCVYNVHAIQCDQSVISGRSISHIQSNAPGRASTQFLTTVNSRLLSNLSRGDAKVLFYFITCTIITFPQNAKQMMIVCAPVIYANDNQQREEESRKKMCEKKSSLYCECNYLVRLHCFQKSNFFFFHRSQTHTLTPCCLS